MAIERMIARRTPLTAEVFNRHIDVTNGLVEAIRGPSQINAPRQTPAGEDVQPPVSVVYTETKRTLKEEEVDGITFDRITSIEFKPDLETQPALRLQFKEFDPSDREEIV